jgi:hypothetical protein
MSCGPNSNAASPYLPLLNLTNGPAVATFIVWCVMVHVNSSGRFRADEGVCHVTSSWV